MKKLLFLLILSVFLFTMCTVNTEPLPVAPNDVTGQLDEPMSHPDTVIVKRLLARPITNTTYIIDLPGNYFYIDRYDRQVILIDGQTTKWTKYWDFQKQEYRIQHLVEYPKVKIIVKYYK